MKSCTDIEQSKKLAEILPIESADMYYFLDPTPAGNIYHLVVQRVDVGTKNIPYYDEGDIPCWSLASLIDVLPLEIETHKQIDGYKIYYYVESYMKCMGKDIYLSTERYENLIDACIEITVKLHEMNLL